MGGPGGDEVAGLDRGVVNTGGTAEFGRASSGVITIASKWGTNEWHGRLYGFARNQRFDARNAMRGFDYTSVDPRLGRTFRLSERWSLQAIAESLNMLNHTNRALPNNVCGTGVEPRVSFNCGVGGPRAGQATCPTIRCAAAPRIGGAEAPRRVNSTLRVF